MPHAHSAIKINFSVAKILELISRSASVLLTEPKRWYRSIEGESDEKLTPESADLVIPLSLLAALESHGIYS